MGWGDCCSVCGGANQNKHRGDTYVLQFSGTVKIGISVDVVDRVYKLSRGDGGTMSPWQGVTPMHLVCLFSGDVEHELHEMFPDAHLMGEWFQADAVLPELPRVAAQHGFSMLPLPCLCGECISRHHATKRATGYEWVTPTRCEWFGSNPGIYGRQCRHKPVATIAVNRIGRRGMMRKRYIPVCEIHAKKAPERHGLRKQRQKVYRLSFSEGDLVPPGGGWM
jgi:hypothetical protein